MRNILKTGKIKNNKSGNFIKESLKLVLDLYVLNVLKIAVLLKGPTDLIAHKSCLQLFFMNNNFAFHYLQSKD